MSYRTVNQDHHDRIRRVREALALLQAAVPEEALHLRREIREIRISAAPGLCSNGAIACTGGALNRSVELTPDSLSLDPVELAVILSHEGRHHRTDGLGRHTLIQHSCSNCSSPFERMLDPIYAVDDQVRRRILKYLGMRDPNDLRIEALFPPGQRVHVDADKFVGLLRDGTAVAHVADADSKVRFWETLKPAFCAAAIGLAFGAGLSALND